MISRAITAFSECFGQTLALAALALAGASGCAAEQGFANASDLENEPAVAETTAALNGPVTCAIQTVNGRYLTAVGGGGRTSDVIHTDATRIGSWEKFTLIDSGDGQSVINYGVQTKTGNFLTAVGGGGRITDVIHSDATQIQGWEKLALHSLGNGLYAIKTIKGYYLTATGGGGQTRDAIHSDATNVGSWEKFKVTCGI